MIALLPRALFGPFMGALVDRWNRRTVLVASHSVIILALVCLAWLLGMGRPPVAGIYAVIFTIACSKSFQMPAMLASTALMVPAQYLNQIAGLNQMLQGVLRVVAPALGALLLYALPMPAIVIVDMCGAVLAIATLLLIAIPRPRRAASATRTSLWKEVSAGIGLVWNWRGAAEMLLISTCINFLSTPAFMLVSILVTWRFHGAEREFGLVSAAIGIGMIGGGLALSFWRGFRRPMHTSLAGVIGMAAALLVTGLAPASLLWPAVVGMFTGGFMIPVCMAPIQALVQKSVEPAMQGRVLTLLDSISTAVAPVSLAIAGPLFDAFGPQAWYISAGALAALVGGLGLITPKVIHLGEAQVAAGG
jgi:DHA3 family macrolide efflux protein-like MFS transporter